MLEDRPRLSHHILSIKNAEASLAFYQQRLGMTLVDQMERSGDGGRERFYFLGYAPPPTTLLVLHQCLESRVLANQEDYRHNKLDGYWKIGITLRDVDMARERLIAAGIEVNKPTQFRDIGYLCHLADPSGYNIELLQHDFAANFCTARVDPQCPLGSIPTLGQITLRIKDPTPSLHFYCTLLGMKLLSRQVVSPYRFTLYFLACSDEQPPDADIDAIGNREWLWKRPYTSLELQHNWDTPSDFRYSQQADNALGFRGIGFETRELPKLIHRLETAGFPAIKDRDWGLGSEISVSDPDGHRVHFLDAQGKGNLELPNHTRKSHAQGRNA